MRLGVGVTEPIRRHPVLIAQAMMTLSHLTKRAPILGIGAGERMNIDPYGLDFSEPVTRLEEALQIIRLCLSAPGTDHLLRQRTIGWTGRGWISNPRAVRCPRSG